LVLKIHIRLHVIVALWIIAHTARFSNKACNGTALAIQVRKNSLSCRTRCVLCAAIVGRTKIQIALWTHGWSVVATFVVCRAWPTFFCSIINHSHGAWGAFTRGHTQHNHDNMIAQAQNEK